MTRPLIHTMWSSASASRASTPTTWTRCSPPFCPRPLSAWPLGLQSGSFPDISSMMSIPGMIKFLPCRVFLCAIIVIKCNEEHVFATVQLSLHCIGGSMVVPTHKSPGPLSPLFHPGRVQTGSSCPVSQRSSGWPSQPVGQYRPGGLSWQHRHLANPCEELSPTRCDVPWCGD